MRLRGSRWRWRRGCGVSAVLGGGVREGRKAFGGAGLGCGLDDRFTRGTAVVAGTSGQGRPRVGDGGSRWGSGLECTIYWI